MPEISPENPWGELSKDKLSDRPLKEEKIAPPAPVTIATTTTARSGSTSARSGAKRKMEKVRANKQGTTTKGTSKCPWRGDGGRPVAGSGGGGQ